MIGLGSMGKNHARVCSELDGIELTGVSDIDIEVSKKIANRLRIKNYTDYRDLMSEIDAAIVATPTIHHYDIVLDLLNNGKHVLIEKPICDTIEKAIKLLTKAKEQGLVLAVGHIERHNPAVRFVKDNLDAKRFGDLITIISKRVSNFPGRIRDVGVIFDFGVHDIDVMRYLSGEVVSVYAKAGKFFGNIEHEDHANIVLNFDNGITGVIEVNWLTPIKIRKLFLTCSKSYIEANYINQSITDSNLGKIEIEKKEPLKREIEDFVKSIEKNKQPLANGCDGVMAIKIAEAACRSYKNDEEVRIK